MIALGSSTMKLNATAEMIPVTWSELDTLIPSSSNQAEGYKELTDNLRTWLCEITGFDDISLQPNFAHKANMLVLWQFVVIM